MAGSVTYDRQLMADDTVVVPAQIPKNKIRKNEFQDNDYFGSKKFDRLVSPYKASKLNRRGLAAALR